MRYTLTALWFLLLSISSIAATFVSRIHSIERGKGNTPDLIFMENGRTAFLDPELKPLDYSLEELQRQQKSVEVTLDSKLNLVSLTLSEREEDGSTDFTLEDLEAPDFYEPSVLTLTQAKSAFNSMRRDYQKESQCYNRAHIWSYEEYKRTKNKTAKLFLFFTSRYIRNFRYKWWFHVTPMALVDGSDVSNWRTMDRRYTKGLRSVKSWSDEFMLNDAACPITSKYSDYSEHQYAEDCYLIPTSMYYWQPRDIDNFERTGYYKKQFFSKELKHAYWEAF